MWQVNALKGLCSRQSYVRTLYLCENNCIGSDACNLNGSPASLSSLQEIVEEHDVGNKCRQVALQKRCL